MDQSDSVPDSNCSGSSPLPTRSRLADRRSLRLRNESSPSPSTRPVPVPVESVRLQARPVKRARFETSDHLTRLPIELLYRIMSHLTEREMCTLAKVCQTFRRIERDEATMWETHYKKVFQLSRPIRIEQNGHLTFLEKADTDWSTWKRSFLALVGRAIHIGLKEETYRRRPYLKRLDDISCLGDNQGDHDDIIMLHQGTYDLTRPLTIRRRGTLIGCALGPVGQIATKVKIRVRLPPEQLPGPLSLVTFDDASKFKLYNCSITLTQLDQAQLAAFDAERYFCLVQVAQSAPHFENCHFSSSNAPGGSCLHVWGERADPHFKACRIVDCGENGLVFSDQANGLADQIEISNCGAPGLTCTSESKPIFRRCQVHSNRDVGVLLTGQSVANFHECDIYRNQASGIEVQDGAAPSVTGSRIYNGETGGVYFRGRGRGYLAGNEIYGNRYAGVWISEESDPTIKDNKIYNGMQGGIYVFWHGKGLIQGNDIYGNQLAGIQIKTKSNPLIRQNKIHSGRHGGIYIHEKGYGTIEHNEIYGNELAAIWITTQSQPIIRNNTIHSGKQVGVYFYDSGAGSLINNQIYNHSYCGIQIRSWSNPTIRGNKIWESKGGILIYSEARGVIEDNDIFENSKAGIWVKLNSDPIIRHNRIHSGHDSGICVFSQSRGTIENNEIFANALSGIFVTDEGTEPKIINNRIYDGQTHGIEISSMAKAVIKKNRIFNNRFRGIEMATGTQVELEDNRIFDNRDVMSRLVSQGDCLYKFTSFKSYPLQDHFKCLTCSTQDTAICTNCIETCHRDHQTVFVRTDRFVCDCGAGTLDENPCQLMNS